MVQDTQNLTENQQKIISPPQFNKIENFLRQSKENWLLYNLVEKILEFSWLV
jgi:hypothetical protein